MPDKLELIAETAAVLRLSQAHVAKGLDDVDRLRSTILDNLPGKSDYFVRAALLSAVDRIEIDLRKALL